MSYIWKRLPRILIHVVGKYLVRIMNDSAITCDMKL